MSKNPAWGVSLWRVEPALGMFLVVCSAEILPFVRSKRSITIQGACLEIFFLSLCLYSVHYFNFFKAPQIATHSFFPRQKKSALNRWVKLDFGIYIFLLQHHSCLLSRLYLQTLWAAIFQKSASSKSSREFPSKNSSPLM